MSSQIIGYSCLNDAAEQCVMTCSTFDECAACDCVAQYGGGGPWGKAMDVIFCLLPLAFLLAATLWPTPLPTTLSLPFSAVMMFLVRTMYLGSDPLLCSSAVILGLHEFLTPLSIMAGAIMLFETMEATKCMPFIMREMKSLTQGHPVSEMVLIFCFAYMVEGASGFGTPVALGAPMMASLGYPKFESVVCLLCLNTFATVWGAVGTPIWFGFGNLNFDAYAPATQEEVFRAISYKSGVSLGLSAFLLVPFTFMFVVPWRVLLNNWLFVVLGLSSCLLPAMGLSFVSYEFPSLLGGLIGCLLNAILIKYQVGVKPYIDAEMKADVSVKEIEMGDASPSPNPATINNKEDQKAEISSNPSDRSFPTKTTTSEYAEPDKLETGIVNGNKAQVTEEVESRRSYIGECIGRTFPIWATVLILILTRVPAIGLKHLLTLREPSFSIYFGTYGTFKLSASLVFQLYNILGYPGMDWEYEFLYVPFFLPFLVVSLCTMLFYRRDMEEGHGCKYVIGTVLDRLKEPAIALAGALVLVQLMLKEGADAPATIVGTILSDAMGGGFIAISAFLGVLGSFFSGSTTISNLTFGNIQLIASQSIGTSASAMLSLQALGGSAGNGVSLSNIIAACAVVGLNVGEGKIIAQTCKIVIPLTILVTLFNLAFFLRFGEVVL